MSIVSSHLEITGFAAAIPPSRRMSENEFVEWCKPRTNAEWVNGEVIQMSPVSFEHNDYVGWLISILRVFVEHFDLGVIGGPEMQVRLTQQRTRREPDVLFVAKDHLQRFCQNHVEGPPDLIVEIVSPESVSRDWRVKYLEYEAAGVREYLVLDPLSRTTELSALNADGKYERVAEVDGKLLFREIPNFYLRLDWLWSKPLPKVSEVLKELGVWPA